MKKILFSGFGGQGVMTLGQMVAIMAMKQQKQVSWMPSYGAEMRGGTANCSAVISDVEIGNPYVNGHIDILCAMNKPSLDKFIKRVKTGGTVVLNSSLIKESIPRNDVRVIPIDATAIASELGHSKTQNMAMLGGIMKATSLFSLTHVEQVLLELLGKKNPKLIPLNLEAVKAGLMS